MAEKCLTDCELKKFADESKKILLETAKKMNLSEASTVKLEQYFKTAYEEMRKKGSCPQKGQCEDIRKKFQDESIKYMKSVVPDNEKELVEKVIAAAFVEINKFQA